MKAHKRHGFICLGCFGWGCYSLQTVLRLGASAHPEHVRAVHDQRVEFVPPSLGTDYLINQVDTGITDVSTLMRPVSMDLVIDYSKNKKFMPPKATWFEPKPLDGLFFYNVLDG